MSAIPQPAPPPEDLPAPGSAHANLPEAAARTLANFDRIGLPHNARVVTLKDDGTETLAEALGTVPDDIALTSIYRGKATRKPMLLIHSASTRVSDKLLSQVVGENLHRADADFVTRFTGFEPEAMPPVGHLNRLPIIMDSGLTRFARVWCSAGAPGVYAAVPTLVLARAISARLVRLVA